MASIKYVAKYGGVSISSVSRYFNMPEVLHPITLSKVKEAVDALQYSPSPIARSLRTKTTNTIAFIIPALTNLFYVDLYSELHAVAANSGWTLNLLTTNGNEETLRKYLSELTKERVDGIIIAFLDENKLIEDIRAAQAQIPLVLITSMPNRGDLNSIFVDAKAGVICATQHLIDKGCTSIAFVGGQRNGPTLEKYKGFESAMSRNGLPINPDFCFFDKNHFSTGFLAARQLLTLKKNPDGIVCATDDIAMGCVKYLIRSKRKVPQDIKVIGFNGISLIDIYEPSISSMQQPLKPAVKEAISLLQKTIKDPCVKRQQITLYATLVVNASTDIDAPASPL